MADTERWSTLGDHRKGKRDMTGNTTIEGYIYFALAPTTKRVKIGFSCDPLRRVKELQTGAGEELILLGAIAGSPQDEKFCHDAYSEHWIAGEWFRFEGMLRGDLEALRSALGMWLPRWTNPEPMVSRKRDSVDMARFGPNQDLAEALVAMAATRHAGRKLAFALLHNGEGFAPDGAPMQYGLAAAIQQEVPNARYVLKCATYGVQDGLVVA